MGDDSHATAEPAAAIAAPIPTTTQQQPSQRWDPNLSRAMSTLVEQQRESTGNLAVPEVVQAMAVIDAAGRIQLDFEGEDDAYDLSAIRETALQCETIAAAAAAERSQQDAEDFRPPQMTVCIMIVGTRGDVQPFIAIAKRLQAHGHRVRLATHAVYRDFVMEHDVEFYPLGGDPKELAAYMVKTGGHLIPVKLETLQKDVPRNMQMIDEILHSTWPAASAPDPDGRGPGVPGPAFRADAIIANPVSYGHIHVAERLGVPLHIMFPQPWVPTMQFPHPLANLPYTWKPKKRNYMSYKLVDLLMWQGVESMVNDFRTETLGLGKIRKGDGGRDLLLDLRIPHAFMWSPHLVAKPADWGPLYDIIGTVTLEQASASYSPTPELETFLGHDGGPIFVGFGSMVLSEPQRVTQMIIDAAAQAKVRVLIQSSWSDMAAGITVPDNVFFLGNCPHDWLMPRVSAVVHHGGAGTTAAGLLAGKPTFIVPFFGDQPFWGRAVVEEGVGVEPCPITKLTTERLRAAFEGLVDPELRRRAVALRELMVREDGAGEAVSSFYRHLPLQLMACDLGCGRIAAKWSQRDRLKLCSVCEFAVTCRPENAPNDVVEYQAVDFSARGPSSMLGGAVSGVGAFVHELGSGVRDLFVAPATGYREGGATGAVIGVAKGVGGFLISPLQGAAVFADHVATGRQNRRRGKARPKLASVLFESHHLKTLFGLKKLPAAHTASMHPEELVSVEHKSGEQQVGVRLTRADKKRLELAIRQFAERKQDRRSKAKKAIQAEGSADPDAGVATTSGDIVHVHVRSAESMASPRSCSVPAMNIVMLCPGGWSDGVQQFVAIGLRLRADGHRVRIAAESDLRSRIVSFGLEFYPLGGQSGTMANFQRRLHEATAKVHQHKSRLAQLARSKLQGRLTSASDRNELRALVFSLWPACVEADPQAPHLAFRADAIISDSLMFGHSVVAERLGVPLHCMGASPQTSTAAFPNPLVACEKLLKPYGQSKMNTVSYKVLRNVASNMLHKILSALRHRLGLEGKPPGLKAIAKWKTPHTYLWSPDLLPKPVDWGQEVTIAGYVEPVDAAEQDDSKRAELEAVQAFVAAASSPVVYFGAPPTKVLDLMSVVEAAATAAQVRVVFQTIEVITVQGSHSMLKIGYDIPATQVLPLVTAAVHCGDVGVVSSCLALAKPACVFPQTTSQRLWGQAVALTGAGIQPLEVGSALTPSSLKRVFLNLLDPSIVAAAERFASMFSASRGVETAVSAFYHHLPVPAMRCDLDPTRLARVYDPAVDLKLSYEAHWMMQELLESDYECLKYKPLQYARRHVTPTFVDVSKKQKSRPPPSKPRSMSDRPLQPPTDLHSRSLDANNLPRQSLTDELAVVTKRRRGHALLTRPKSFAAHVEEVPEVWATKEQQEEGERLIHAAYERMVRDRLTYPAKIKRHHKK